MMLEANEGGRGGCLTWGKVCDFQGAGDRDLGLFVSPSAGCSSATKEGHLPLPTAPEGFEIAGGEDMPWTVYNVRHRGWPSTCSARICGACHPRLCERGSQPDRAGSGERALA